MITYLFACSNPSITFINSSCLCTTMAELTRIFAAGCLSLSTPSGSSGTWTGDSRLLSSGFVSCNAFETASMEDEPFSEIPGELSGFLGICDGWAGRRYLLRGPRGRLVAKHARTIGFDGGRETFRSNTPRGIMFGCDKAGMGLAIESCRALLTQVDANPVEGCDIKQITNPHRLIKYDPP